MPEVVWTNGERIAEELEAPSKHKRSAGQRDPAMAPCRMKTIAKEEVRVVKSSKTTKIGLVEGGLEEAGRGKAAGQGGYGTKNEEHRDVPKDGGP